ncbi:MAG: ABC transporter substrate-binding protein [Afipia sp.]|nr:ABC transporter substrate-binding protein [Afipia sp.]
MDFFIRAILGVVLICTATGSGANAQSSPVKIAVMEDMGGPLSASTGNGSVIAAKLAIQDFGGQVLGAPIALVIGDHQNKADIAVGLARSWYDTDNVSAIVGLGNSSAALAVRALSREKSKLDIVVSGGSSDLTGKACSPTGFHWVYDTYALAKSTGGAAVRAGSDTWFFITADYAFGHALERDTTNVVLANKGRVLGAVRAPLGTPDFSSFLLQAQSSKAKIIGLANAGNDTSTAIKQAGEFGIVKAGQKMAGLLVFITDIHAIGLQLAQGLLLTEAFYWDLDPQTREWSARFFKEHKAMPTMLQAGIYSAVTHYLKSVKAVGSADPAKVAAQMRETKINDFFTKDATIRSDGRVIRDMYLFEVKKPEESSKPWDYYKLIAKVPGSEVFRSLEEGQCEYELKR